MAAMNGIFAVDKPVGASSSNVILQLKKIFMESKIFANDVKILRDTVRDDLTRSTKFSSSKIDNKVKKACIKIGHGGTLDPLASGILIVGVGTGTKQLSYFLGQCTKTYEARAVLGQATTSGDSEGEIIRQTNSDHVTLDTLRSAARKFVGKSKQTPPIYSALKVKGKPLYEYAREGIPVPEGSIKPRDVEVLSMEVHDDFGVHDTYKALKPNTGNDSLEKAVFSNPTLDDHKLCYSEEFLADESVAADEKDDVVPFTLKSPDSEYVADLPVFHTTTTVGSGTYIRSLLSDVARACGTSAHMCELRRTKQSDWELGKNVFSLTDFTERDESEWGPALKKILDGGASVDLAQLFENGAEKGEDKDVESEAERDAKRRKTEN